MWINSCSTEPQQLESFKSAFLALLNVPIRTVVTETATITGHLQLIYNSPCIASIVLNHIVIVLHNSETDMKWPMINYRIAGNFDGGKYWRFWRFQPDRQNLTRQIFKAIQRLVKDCDHPSKYFPSNIWKVSVRQNFPPSKFPAIRYMLFCTLALLIQYIHKHMQWKGWGYMAPTLIHLMFSQLAQVI